MTVFGILVTLILGLLGRELWGWIPRLSRGVIWLITLPLARERRRRRREEWAAELAVVYDERRLTGLLWTLKLSGVCARESLRRMSSPFARLVTWRMLGFVILLTWLIEAVAGGFAICIGLALPTIESTLLAVVLGVTMLVVERLAFSVLSWPPRPPVLLSVLFMRLALSVGLSYFVSQLLLARLFASDINASAGISQSASTLSAFYAFSSFAGHYPIIRIYQIVFQVLLVLFFTLPVVAKLVMRRHLVER
jgi:hypothetical protein